ncbi:MAM domain-containing protein 2-like [Antedon mediterranea]|uniref:MAM domain-containing protein 2-like n=1 Tax=Antedon mediterranea TaxID=105859 RepID=UPI003AF7ECC0
MIYPLCEWTVEGWKVNHTQSKVPNSNGTNAIVGNFIYVDSGNSATTTSPFLTTTAVIDFKLWYYMHGSQNITLNVYIQDADSMELVFTVTGDKGNRWNEASISVQNPLNRRIVVEGQVNSFAGIIGLDDFIISNTSSKNDGSCDFEEGDICNYRQVLADDFDWVRQTGKTPTNGTGPPSGHTANNSTFGGFYMYIESSSHTEGQAARIATPPIGPASAICVSFWYYMYGDSSERSIGPLNVYKTDVNSDDLTYSLFSLHGNQGNKWYDIKINIRSYREFQIVFEGIRGNSDKSDIAIDDVNVVRHSWCNGSSVPEHLVPPTVSLVDKAKTYNPTLMPPTSMPGLLPSDTNRTKIDDDTTAWHLNNGLVTLIIACGLSFWAMIFTVIFISMCRSCNLRKKEIFCQLENETYYFNPEEDQLKKRCSETDNETF